MEEAEEDEVEGAQSSVGCAGPPGDPLANSVALTLKSNKIMVSVY